MADRTAEALGTSLRRFARGGAAAAAAAALLGPGLAGAQNCQITSVGFTPLDDLGTGLHLERFEGGLYPDGANQPPPEHLAEGVSRALSIEPLDTDGNPDPDGSYLLLSIGMSNATQEFCARDWDAPGCDPWTFMGQAAVHPDVRREGLQIVNGAKGGEVATNWDHPQDSNYFRIRDRVLAPRGLSEAQVQIVWVKSGNPFPSVSLVNCPGELQSCPGVDAVALTVTLGDTVRALQTRYPNLKLVLLSSRIYAGYAGYPVVLWDLNPEPYAYESGFSVKWLIEAQIDQMSGAGVDPLGGDLDYAGTPWLGWATYLWADGTTPRSDGLAWECADVDSDGTHPAQSGEQKVGAELLDSVLTSPVSAPWFAVPEPSTSLLGAVALTAVFVMRRRGNVGPPRQRG
jgi:hypothetical protein